MADFTIRDNNTKLRVSCLKRDGNVFNLTGHTVKLRFRIHDIDHKRVDMNIIDATNGIAEYVFITGAGYVIDATNNKMDIKIGGVDKVFTVANGSYFTGDDLAAAVLAELQATDPATPWDFTIDGFNQLRFAFDSGFAFPHILLLGTGANLANSIWETIGFTTGVDSTLFPVHESDKDGIQVGTTDLGQQGIMYAEIEIIETATGLLVSSSDELIFTVRGKVSDG